jgi:hypothetical protein
MKLFGTISVDFDVTDQLLIRVSVNGTGLKWCWQWWNMNTAPGQSNGDNITNKTKSLVLSPQTNCTEWATATCWQNLVPTFVDREVSCGQWGGSPTVVNLSFLDRSRYFSFIYPHKGWVDPVPNPLLLRKSGNAENRTRDIWVSSQELWPLDHRHDRDNIMQ